MAGFLARWFLPFIGLGRGRVAFGLGAKTAVPVVIHGPICPVATDYTATLLVATDNVAVMIVATDSCCS